MKSVIQRVKRASVKVEDKIIGQINKGLLVLLAVHEDDEEHVIEKMAEKVINLRIFDDELGKMNLSVKDIKGLPAPACADRQAGEILIVSQFTLYGDCTKGNRPSFIKSAKPEKALLFYEKFVKYIREDGIKVETGKFGSKMEVELVNDGPVTIILDL